MSTYPNAVSPTANGNQWSAVVIEDLLMREFMNGENINHLIPPTPLAGGGKSNNVSAEAGDAIPAANPAKQLREANKAFVRYLRGGGISWTASGTPAASQQSQMMTSSSQFSNVSKVATSMTPAGTTKSASPTPTHHQSSSYAFQQQQNKPAVYSATTPSSAPTVPSSPSNALVASVKSPTYQQYPTTTTANMFPLGTSSSVNTLHQSPKGAKSMMGASSSKTMGPPSSMGASSSSSAPQYSTQLGAVSQECSRVHVNFPSNIPTNATLSTAKRRPHDDLVRARIQAQDSIDPDLIFAQPREDFPLDHIFRHYPKVLSALAQSRGMSGDWVTDTFTDEEEAKYKEDMGYTSVGLSQSSSSFLFHGMM